MKKVIQGNFKILIGIIIGIIISGASVYALNIIASEVAYDNTNSGSTKTNMQDAIDDLYDKANSNKTDSPVILDSSRFNSDTFNTLVFNYLQSSGGAWQEGFCTQTKVNMDLVNKITIAKMQHYHTYAPIAYIAFFDEYTNDYTTIVNNAISSKGWTGNTSNSWVHTAVNWEIDTSNIKGYKYIAMAYTQQHTSYSSHLIFPETVTIN